ncbi:MAG TPA: tRNA pseudouridine(55) synthase TruB [Gemmatimonadaceae bacterium]|jgi:tRNA pseudouridine55 synthase|nr:tRNA pseudouridine(55) synthase TruB [Gemmatimonadaceae bacterium]
MEVTTNKAKTTSHVEGLLLADKPAGVTSHDVILAARRAYNERSIGHLGTLDPFATGLLLLLFGRSTRLATFIVAEPKVYEAEIRFGSETDTDDLTGEVVRTAELPDVAAIQNGIRELTGDLMQVPPAYSAKSVDGERAYDAARRGEHLELAPAPVHVESWKITDITPESLRATITCGQGTYIRALARDLGRMTGSAAHLASLRRVRCGDFDVRDAATLADLRDSPPPLRSLSVVAGNV